MPARSQKQLTAIRIAEHQPDKLLARNKGLLSMKPADMKDFASTPAAGLPVRAPKKKRSYYGE